MPVLVVQMGHVGRPPCPGSVGTAGEQNFTQRAGDACTRLLNGRNGWTVKVIDADPGYFTVRSQIGGDPNAYRGDAFVAIHCDGSTNPDRNGASFGYREGGRGFAQDIKGAYLLRTGRPASWLEPDNYTTNLSQYYGTGLATQVGNTRAVIFETGFLTNPDDKAMLLADTGPDNVALAIGSALGITAQEDTVSLTTTEHGWLEDILRRVQSIHVNSFLPIGPGTAYPSPPPWQSGGNLTFFQEQLNSNGTLKSHTQALAELISLHTGTAVSEDPWAEVLAAAERGAREGAAEGASAQVLAGLEAMETRLRADDAEQAKAGALEALGELRELLNKTPQ